MFADRLEVSQESRSQVEYEGRTIDVVSGLGLKSYLEQLHQVDPDLVIQVYNSPRSRINVVWGSARIDPIELVTDGKIEGIGQHFSLEVADSTYLSYVGSKHLYDEQTQRGDAGDVYLRLNMKARDLRKLATEVGAGSFKFNIDPYT